MKDSHSKKHSLKRILFFILVPLVVLLAAIPLWHYNTFIYEHAARQIPPEYKKYIEKYKIAKLVKLFHFSEENSLKEWEEKVFKGKVIYRVEKEKNLSYVKATSNASASALYYKIKLDAKTKHPIVSWKWNVEKFPVKKSKENLETQDENDFAARVYVIFPAKFLVNSKVLEYIWSETIPAGTIGVSPYSKNIKLIVARSGENKNKEWFLEERDIIADYLKVFGRPPEHDIGAVAFMTNAEHTGTDAVSMYDEIKLGYKEDGVRGGDELSEDRIFKKKVYNR